MVDKIDSRRNPKLNLVNSLNRLLNSSSAWKLNLPSAKSWRIIEVSKRQNPFPRTIYIRLANIWRGSH